MLDRPCVREIRMTNTAERSHLGLSRPGVTLVSVVSEREAHLRRSRSYARIGVGQFVVQFGKDSAVEMRSQRGRERL
jgi:hypothetical protein